uniref:Dopey N-terminal domain-containing protein n=1 Tax=Anopheles coluzzii TaxID=1518534 RepID=A0A8W7P6M5_ANOCL
MKTRSKKKQALFNGTKSGKAPPPPPPATTTPPQPRSTMDSATGSGLMEEYDLMKQQKYRVYISNIDKALKNFEYSSEWADLISALGKLNKVISSNAQYQIIPRRIKISKRLAQCMHPALPSGVHLKALESYDVIFSNIGVERLASELFIYSAGLFPLLGYSAMNVRPTLLSIYEKYFVPLGEKLRPALSGFLSGVFPGLEAGQDHFERTNQLLDKVCIAVQLECFYTCLWECIVTNASVRLPAITYVLEHYDKKVPCAAQRELMGSSAELMVNGLCSCLSDAVILVQRNTLEFLLLAFPMHDPLLSEMYTTRLVKTALNTILRRDMSLNRRLYSWLLGSDTSMGKHMQGAAAVGTAAASQGSSSEPYDPNTYFERHAKKRLIAAFKMVLKESIAHTPVDLSPYRILISLLDKAEIGLRILDDVLCDIIRAISLCNGNLEVQKSANLLFSTFDPAYIWNYMARLYREAATRPERQRTDTDPIRIDSGPATTVEVCHLTEFLLETLSLEMYNETTRVHLPKFLLSLIRMLTTYESNMHSIEVGSSLRLLVKIVSKIQPMIMSEKVLDLSIGRGTSATPQNGSGLQSGETAKECNNLEKSSSDSKIHETSLQVMENGPFQRSSSSQGLHKKGSSGGSGGSGSGKYSKKSKKSKSYTKLSELSSSREGSLKVDGSGGEHVSLQDNVILNANDPAAGLASANDQDLVVINTLICELEEVFETLLTNSQSSRVKLTAMLAQSVEGRSSATGTKTPNRELNRKQEYEIAQLVRGNEKLSRVSLTSISESLRNALKLACNVLTEMSSFPSYRNETGNTERLDDVPGWLKALTVLAIFVNDLDTQLSAAQTLIDMIGLLRTNGKKSSKDSGNGKTIVLMMPLLKLSHVNCLERRTKVFQVLTTMLWDYLDASRPEARAISLLLYRIHNCLDSRFTEDVIINRLLVPQTLFDDDETAEAHYRGVVERTVRRKDPSALHALWQTPVLAKTELKIDSEGFRKFQLLWKLGRDTYHGNEFEKLLFLVLDSLTLPRNVSIQVKTANWLREALVRGDIGRILKLLLKILLNESTKRLSVFCPKRLRGTGGEFEDGGAANGGSVSEWEKELLADADVQLNQACFAVSSEDGQIRYHMDPAAGLGKKRSPIRSIQKKILVSRLAVEAVEARKGGDPGRSSAPGSSGQLIVSNYVTNESVGKKTAQQSSELGDDGGQYGKISVIINPLESDQLPGCSIAGQPSKGNGMRNRSNSMGLLAAGDMDSGISEPSSLATPGGSSSQFGKKEFHRSTSDLDDTNDSESDFPGHGRGKQRNGRLRGSEGYVDNEPIKRYVEDGPIVDFISKSSDRFRNRKTYLISSGNLSGAGEDSLLSGSSYTLTNGLSPSVNGTITTDEITNEDGSITMTTTTTTSASGDYTGHEEDKPAPKVTFTRIKSWRNGNKLYPFHTHFLVYESVFNTKQVLYTIETLRNILTNDARFFLCLSVTTSVSSGHIKSLLLRHRRNIFGKGFTEARDDSEHQHLYRGSMYLEVILTVLLYYTRSYQTDQGRDGKGRQPSRDDFNTNAKIQLECIELMTTIFGELLAVVRDVGKNLANYVADLLEKCKVQKIVLYCLASSVNYFSSPGGYTCPADEVLRYSDPESTRQNAEAYQIELLRLLLAVLKLEHEITLQRADGAEGAPTTGASGTTSVGGSSTAAASKSGIATNSSASPTKVAPETKRTYRYAPNMLLAQQPMFLSTILSALASQQISLASMFNASTGSSNGLTAAAANQSGQIINNIMNVFLSYSSSLLSGGINQQVKKSHQEVAKAAILSHLPRIIITIATLWETSISEFRRVKHQLLEFLSPISMHYGTNFLTAIAVAWYERSNSDATTTQGKASSSTSVVGAEGAGSEAPDVDFFELSLPQASNNQLLLVKLITGIRIMSVDSFIQTMHQVIKSPPPIYQPPAGLNLEVSALELLYFFLISGVSPAQYTDCWSSLYALLKDCLALQITAQFVALSILNEFVQRCPTMPFSDKKDLRDLHDVTSRLVEAVSNVAGSCLEQTTWLRRNLSVKEEFSSIESTGKDGLLMPSSQHYSIQAQSILASLLASLLDVAFSSQEKDKVTTIVTGVMYNIVPYLKTHTVKNIPTFHACSNLLASLSTYQYIRKAWRKDALDLLLDTAFFQMDSRCLPYWKTILDSLMTCDNTTFRDLMNRLPLAQTGTLNIFTSKEQEYEQRALLLKRLAFIIFCSEVDQYHKYMPEIQEQLANSLRLPQVVPLIQSAVFLCFRVLLLRMSADHVTSLWPIIIAEMVQVFLSIEQELMTDTEEFSQHIRMLSGLDTAWVTNTNNGLYSYGHPHWRMVQLETAKLLELGCVLPATILPHFQMYRWAFVSSQNENLHKTGGYDEKKMAFIPHVSRISQLMDLRYTSHSPVSSLSAASSRHFNAKSACPPHRQKTQTTKGKHIMLTCQSINTLQDLYGFFSTLSMRWPSHISYSDTEKDTKQCLEEVEHVLALDFLEKIPSTK